MIRATELDAEAASETHEEVRSELETLARAYRRLAEQAQRNAELNLGQEAPVADPHDKS